MPRTRFLAPAVYHTVPYGQFRAVMESYGFTEATEVQKVGGPGMLKLYVLSKGEKDLILPRFRDEQYVQSHHMVAAMTFLRDWGITEQVDWYDTQRANHRGNVGSRRKHQ